jgi:hypothetical protein
MYDIELHSGGFNGHQLRRKKNTIYQKGVSLDLLVYGDHTERSGS